MRDSNAVEEVLRGGGECGALLRRVDWAKTALGPVETWPQSLRTTVGIVLASNYPLYLAWGPRYVQMYNDAYRPICGATKHPAALGQEAAVTWPEVWDTVLAPGWERIQATGAPIRVEDLMMPLERNGYVEECYFSYSHSPIRDESGGVGGIFAALMETTGRVLNERRLRTLSALGAAALGQETPEATCREAARVLAANPNDVPLALLYLTDAAGKAARLVSQSGVPLGSRAAPPEVSLDDEAAGDTWPLARVARTGEPLRLEPVPGALGPLPSGPWPEATSSVLVLPMPRPGHARPLGFLVLGISPRRALDDSYRRFLELVASGVTTAAATARARQEERRRAEALAELDRAKTAFFSNVSHEFRTPLTLMLGPVEDGLQDPDEPLGPRQRQRQVTVHRNGLRLLKLVNTLLDFSRIEAGRTRATFAPTDLGALTADLASAFRSTVERAGLKLVVSCQPMPEPTWVDRELWEKVILNLLSNAFKFTFTGEIRVACAAHDDGVEVAVTDTGTGIPEAELPRIFERFHRVQGARGRSYEGSGIGLALVQELVKLHGGSLSARSVEGQGSTFTVRLPRGHAHLPAEHLAPGATQHATSLPAFVSEAESWLGAGDTQVLHGDVPPSAASATVLLVEDNADMRDYVQRLLSGRYTVETAANGHAALEAVRARRPDLVLSDVMMPGLDGFGLLRALRASPLTSDIPLILLSARAGEEATIEGLEAGANDYLVKPFSARELLARVEGNLALARAREEQRQVEQARQALAVVVEQSAEAIGIADPEGRVTYLNEAAQRMLGVPGLEAARRTVFLDYFPAEDQAFIRDTVLPTVAAQGRWEGELQLRNLHTGVHIPVLYNVATLTDTRTGQPVGMVAAGRELSEQKRQEAEARRRAEFEQQLIGIVSHDLRNPLSAIQLGASVLARREELSERSLRSVLRIQASAERAVRMTRDLLDFTQVRMGGGLPVHRRPVDLHDLAQQVLEELRISHPEREFRVESDGDAQGEWDPDRIAQMLGNLVGNALQYSPPDSRVTVRVHGEDARVLLCVHNEGPPIPAEARKRLFRPLQRARTDGANAGRSIGLGLFIVKHIVESHGGTIEVTSREGEGTTFIAWLPRRSTPPAEAR
ncbi:ATP-binding protein [Corallococcus macrosporus]|uniref:histidine kinase n=1 Tax=Corallococcus macrosporus DSM 14697 TaxID=1189310 RepID=A0A286NW81_9BACT|nr:ATP-binding protein [Corallococcus macrosporus]ATB51426.1 two-component system sensor histidine kinase/response regulator [Corallococcus macrosporus DSM 14697]